MVTFQLFFFSVQGTGGSSTRPDPENRVGVQVIGSTGRPVSSGLQGPVSRSIVVQEQDPLGDLPAALFLQNVLQLHQQRYTALIVWKIINEEDAVLIPKNRSENFFQRIFALGIFWGVVSRYAAIPLIVALSAGRSDISRFRRRSPIATGNHLDRAEKLPDLLRRPAPLTFSIRVQAFRDPLDGELPHAQLFMSYGPNPLTWDAQLLSYWFSQNPAVFQD